MAALMYWNNKTSIDNNWHPRPGQDPKKDVRQLPRWLDKIDLAATAVDAAPFVTAAGFIAYVRQYNRLGWTVPASVFRNPKTLAAFHLTAMYVTPIVCLLQATDVQYRNVIPRWASERELRRDETTVRDHVNTGMLIGAVSTALRTFYKLGPRYSLVDIIFGGALADLLHREYLRAHNL